MKSTLFSLLHSEGFFPSWTDAICPFKLWFDVKILPHILQWLRAWWTAKIYVYLNSDLKQSFYHIYYNHKVVVLWTEYKCLFNCNFLEKEASQYIHLCGLMPSWTTKICLFQFIGSEKKLLSQILQS